MDVSERDPSGSLATIAQTQVMVGLWMLAGGAPPQHPQKLRPKHAGGGAIRGRIIVAWRKAKMMMIPCQ
jgi:hypothetical protein